MGRLGKTRQGWEMCICWGRTAAEDLFPLQGKGVSRGLLPSAGNAAGGGRNWRLGPCCIYKAENQNLLCFCFFLVKEKSPLVVEMLWPPLPFVALCLLSSEMPLTICVDVNITKTSYFLVCRD